MPTRSPATTTTVTLEEDDVFGPVWGSPQAGSTKTSQHSFSSAVRRTDGTPSKRRRGGSDAVAHRGRTDHDRCEPPPSHSRSRTVDDEAGAGNGAYRTTGRSTSQHPLKRRSSQASSSSWTLDHGTRPGMRRALSSGDADADGGARAASGTQESVTPDREMLVIVHEVSFWILLLSLLGTSSARVPFGDYGGTDRLWVTDSGS